MAEYEGKQVKVDYVGGVVTVMWGERTVVTTAEEVRFHLTPLPRGLESLVAGHLYLYERPLR